MSRKMSKEIINKRLEHRPLELIGDYVSTKLLSTFKCLKPECEHQWPATPNNILRGKGCPKCARTLKLTNEIIDERIKHKNIKRISDYEGNSEIKMEWECEEGHRFFVPPKQMVNTNKGCRECGLLSNKMIDKRIKDRNFIRLGEVIDGKTKIEWKCLIDGNTWFATPTKVMVSKIGCPECKIREDTFSNEFVDKFLLQNKLNIKRLDNYIDCKIRMRWLCEKCDHEWPTPFDSIRSKGTGCPQCKLKNEGRIRKYLKARYGKNTANKFTFFVDNRRHTIDFEVNGVFIEYNGRQHYEPVNYFGGDLGFAKQEARDKRVREYCLANNIRLIEIPYSLSEEEQYKLIDNLYLEI